LATAAQALARVSHRAVDPQVILQRLHEVAEASVNAPVPLILCPLVPPSLKGLRDALRTEGKRRTFPAVHISARLSADGKLLFEDQSGEEQGVAPSELPAVFEDQGVLLVVLCVPSGRAFARRLVARGVVRSVVAFKGEVTDAEMAYVTGELYRRLVLPMPLGRAVADAQAALTEAYARGWLEAPETVPATGRTRYGHERAANLVLEGDPSLVLEGGLKPAEAEALRRRFEPPPSNLPQPAGLFLGREEEMKRLTDWLRNRDRRAIVVTGLGGIGKSTLVVHAAARNAWRFRGVIYLSIRDPVTADHGFMDALCQEMDAVLKPAKPFSRLRTPQEKRHRVAAFLKEHRCLLVLDNLETLETKQRAELEALLDAIGPAPGTTLLMTLRPERFTPLLPNRTPEFHALALRGLAPAAAMELLGELLNRAEAEAPAGRGGSVWDKVPDSPPSEEVLTLLEPHQSTTTVFGDPRRLQKANALLTLARAAGLHPFLLRAAARGLDRPEGRWVSVLARLEQGDKESQEWVDGLVGQMVEDLVQRSPEALELLHCAAAFQGGAGEEALRDVFATGASPGVFADAVREAREASLLEWLPGARRYDVHPLVRRYLARQAEARRRWTKAHTRFFLDYVKRCGRDHAALDAERLNILAAMAAAEGALAAPERVSFIEMLFECLLAWGVLDMAKTHLDAGARAAHRMHQSATEARVQLDLAIVCRHQGEFAEAEERLALSEALSRRSREPRLKAGIHRERGLLNWLQGKYPEALNHLKESLKLLEELEDPRELAATLHALAVVYRCANQSAEAEQHFHEALQLAHTSGDVLIEAQVRHDLGVHYHAQGDPACALEYLRESLELTRKRDNKRGMAWTLLELAGVLADRRKFDMARVCLHQSLALSEDLGDKFGRARALVALARLCVLRKALDEAREYLSRALVLQREMGDRRGETATLFNLAEVERFAKNYPAAREFYKASLKWPEATGNAYWRALNFIGLGRCARQEGKIDPARVYFQSALDLARGSRLDRIARMAADELAGLDDAS
jgi:tetratricopeptide (TPR) repeat protein